MNSHTAQPMSQCLPIADAVVNTSTTIITTSPMSRGQTLEASVRHSRTKFGVPRRSDPHPPHSKALCFSTRPSAGRGNYTKTSHRCPGRERRLNDWSGNPESRGSKPLEPVCRGGAHRIHRKSQLLMFFKEKHARASVFDFGRF